MSTEEKIADLIKDIRESANNPRLRGIATWKASQFLRNNRDYTKRLADKMTNVRIYWSDVVETAFGARYMYGKPIGRSYLGDQNSRISTALTIAGYPEAGGYRYVPSASCNLASWFISFVPVAATSMYIANPQIVAVVIITHYAISYWLFKNREDYAQTEHFAVNGEFPDTYYNRFIDTLETFPWLAPIEDNTKWNK